MCVCTDGTWFEGYVVIFEDHLNFCAGTLIGVEAMKAHALIGPVSPDLSIKWW